MTKTERHTIRRSVENKRERRNERSVEQEEKREGDRCIITKRASERDVTTEEQAVKGGARETDREREGKV